MIYSEMRPVIDLAPIRIKLYPYECKLLNEYLAKIHINVVSFKGAASDAHIALTEWYRSKFLARSFRIESSYAKAPKAVEIPISVARILMYEMTANPLHTDLNMILGQIHRQLCNRDFLPL